MFFALGQSPESVCPRCDKQVYFNERVRANGNVYHRWCFRCVQCNFSIPHGQQCEHKEDIFCKTCYNKKFGPKGYGFGIGAGILTDTGVRGNGRPPSVEFLNPLKRFLPKRLSIRSTRSNSDAKTIDSAVSADVQATPLVERSGLPDFDVVFLGTGVSTAVPMMQHILDKRDCICKQALADPTSKNRRNNVSILVRFIDKQGVVRNIMVDCGKTVRDAVLNTFPGLDAKGIDALFLTHGHADAIMGLDDIRDLQSVEEEFDEDGNHIGYRIDTDSDGKCGLRVLATDKTLSDVKRIFPYLDAPPNSENFAKPGVIKRRVAVLNFQEVQENDSVNLFGLPVRIFPVIHGGTLVSLGFTFGSKSPFVYISDVSSVPDETMEYLQSLGTIDTLVVDALRRQKHGSHFSLDEALEFIDTLEPKTAYLVGIAGCEMGDHQSVNKELRRRGGATKVRLAHDGMQLSFAA